MANKSKYALTEKPWFWFLLGLFLLATGPGFVFYDFAHSFADESIIKSITEHMPTWLAQGVIDSILTYAFLAFFAGIGCILYSVIKLILNVVKSMQNKT